MDAIHRSVVLARSFSVYAPVYRSKEAALVLWCIISTYGKVGDIGRDLVSHQKRPKDYEVTSQKDTTGLATAANVFK